MSAYNENLYQLIVEFDINSDKNDSDNNTTMSHFSIPRSAITLFLGLG